MFFISIFSDYVINSRVVSASLSQGRHIQLPKNVEITFQHLTPNLTDPVCVFWNFELPGWSDSGCWVTKTNVTSTTCECEHLTNFAVIMKKSSSDRNVISAKLGPTTVFVLEIVTYVAVALSIVFIFIILYKVRIVFLKTILLKRSRKYYSTTHYKKISTNIYFKKRSKV